jgi:6-phosphofructokinase
MRIGMLTGGGDCPGLNAVIRAVVRKGEGVFGHNIIGFRYGWRGVMECQTVDLTTGTTRGILHRGGTILGTSRTNPYKSEDGVRLVLDTLKREHVDALVAIGGEDTLGVASRLSDEGVRMTIDNDLSATDFTFGFDTAVQIATDAIDRLHTTAESHDRVMVCEVMGRHAGWIATYAGMAGGADVILIPEEPFDVDEVCDRIRHRHLRGARFSIRRPTSTSSATSASAGSATSSRPRSRAVRASRRGSRSSGTSSGAAPPRPTTGSWPPGSGSTPSTPSTSATSASWWLSGAPTSSGSRWPTPSGN